MSPVFREQSLDHVPEFGDDAIALFGAFIKDYHRIVASRSRVLRQAIHVTGDSFRHQVVVIAPLLHETLSEKSVYQIVANLVACDVIILILFQYLLEPNLSPHEQPV